MSQSPSIGRVVHYTLREGRSAGQNRPAIVVRAWDGAEHGSCNLQVFLDGSNDDGAEGVDGNAAPFALATWVTSVHEGDQPGTWHWPPRVP